MTSYFAYGSNMFPQQMRERCPDHEEIGIGTLDGYRFRIMSRGYATIFPSAGDQVIGVLYKISANDEETLDQKEGVRVPERYRKAYLPVHGPDGIVNALVYIDDDTREGAPRQGYMEKILTGAREHCLPEEYVGFLRSFEAR